MSRLTARSTPTSNLLARLIEAPQLDRIVRELPSQQFTALIREVGVEDAGELVALATTEQLVAAFDEDLFVSSELGERERFDSHRFVIWLEVLLEAGDAAVARRVAELSEDFVAHALSSLVVVLDHDALRERITGDHEAAVEADAALERALNEEIDGYLLVARAEQGWDAVLALVLALDRHDRALLVRLLDRCATLASSYVDDLDALTELLSEAESLADDVEAAREQRRSALGHVEPRAARGFLALARMPMSGALEQQGRDASTRAYLREFDRSAPASPPARTHVDTKLDRMLAELAEAGTGAGAEVGSTAESSPSELVDESPPLALALQELGDEAPASFHERLAELAYLANVVLAAVPDEHGLRLRPAAAAQAALSTVALGAELDIRERRGDSPARASAAELREALARHPADLLFRKACSTLVARGWSGNAAGIVGSQAELEQALAWLDAEPLAGKQPAAKKAAKSSPA